jgi:hypothetical protein
MSDPVRELQDIEAIKRLKAAYFRCVDEEDWEQFRALFADDASFDVETRLFDDADSFLAAVVAHHTLAEVRTVHHGHMPEIELTGPDTARGIWAMEDYVDRIWAEDGRREAFRGYGHYHEEYRREDGRWKIASLRLTRIRVDLLPVETLPPFAHRGGPAGSILPASAARG